MNYILEYTIDSSNHIKNYLLIFNCLNQMQSPQILKHSTLVSLSEKPFQYLHRKKNNIRQNRRFYQ